MKFVQTRRFKMAIAAIIPGLLFAYVVAVFTGLNCSSGYMNGCLNNNLAVFFIIPGVAMVLGYFVGAMFDVGKNNP